MERNYDDWPIFQPEPMFATLEELFAHAGWDAETQARVRADIELTAPPDVNTETWH